MINIELLRRIEKHILEEPKRLYMGNFVLSKQKGDRLIDADGALGEFPSCGTAACIAGWAVLLEEGIAQGSKYSSGEIMGKAMVLIGLNLSQADRLFFRLGWPVEFTGGGIDDGDPKTAKIAVRRIEHFIETGGLE